MLYHIFIPLVHQFPILNLFRYITFRTGGALMTALIISFIFGSRFISKLKNYQKKGQPIRKDGPEKHLLSKKGTPTMGGLLILLALIFSTVLWSNLKNGFVWIVLLVAVGFGLIGLIDDYLKLSKFDSKGLSVKIKFVLQIIVSLIATILIISLKESHLATSISIPFFKNLLFNLGWFFIPFSMFIIIGSSNAVNLTDGLDGLAIVPVMIVAVCFLLISYLVGNHIFSNYLQINYVFGSGELSVFCGALIGAGLGFLWFNAPPAMVFMGDTGSLSMGGALGTISVITKHEIVLGIIGGLFVVETVSVIIQVVYYKITGKRIFLMAPIHHHFEKIGWPEPTIVIRFWIIATILAMIGLSTLKLR